MVGDDSECGNMSGGLFTVDSCSSAWIFVLKQVGRRPLRHTQASTTGPRVAVSARRLQDGHRCKVQCECDKLQVRRRREVRHHMFQVWQRIQSQRNRRQVCSRFKV